MASSKKGLRNLESVGLFLEFVNGSADDPLEAIQDSARALAELLAEVTARKGTQPPPWRLDLKKATAASLEDMKWYCDQASRALQLAAQLEEQDDVLRHDRMDSTLAQPMREAVQALILNTFYADLRVLRCARPACDHFVIEDRPGSDASVEELCGSTACRQAAEAEKAERGAYWEEGKQCVREVRRTGD